MSNSKFTSPKIAIKMAEAFGSEAKPITVDMKYHKEVGDFVLKIEHAHQKANNSRHMYKALSK